MSTVRVASVQSNVAFDDPETNARRAIAHLETLAAQSVDLVVFPEAYLTGYCVADSDAACALALPVSLKGDRVTDLPPALRSVRDAAARLGVHVVLGLAAQHDEKVINLAVLIEPNGTVHGYRKTHLPELGLDKHVEAGPSLPVFDTAVGRIGILICFDLRPPEPMRVLAMKGADLVVLPTNWPVGAEISASTLSIARAVENRVAFVSCNRVGEENGFRFIGMSSIVDPLGNVLARAGADEEVLIADLDLALSRQKRVATIPGSYEWTVFESRRPDLYGPLVQPRPEPAN